MLAERYIWDYVIFLKTFKERSIVNFRIISDSDIEHDFPP